MKPSIKSKLSRIAIAAPLLAISSSLCAGVLGWILVVGGFRNLEFDVLGVFQNEDSCLAARDESIKMILDAGIVIPESIIIYCSSVRES